MSICYSLQFCHRTTKKKKMRSNIVNAEAKDCRTKNDQISYYTGTNRADYNRLKFRHHLAKKNMVWLAHRSYSHQSPSYSNSTLPIDSVRINCENGILYHARLLCLTLSLSPFMYVWWVYLCVLFKPSILLIILVIYNPAIIIISQSALNFTHTHNSNMNIVVISEHSHLFKLDSLVCKWLH